MKQQLFQDRYQENWLAIEQALIATGDPLDSHFPQDYRALCQHLAVAKARRYSPHLVNRLNRLVVAAHHLLYQHNSRYQYRWLKFLILDFPQVLRANGRYIATATALFVIPLLLMGLGCYFNEELIYSMMAPADVRDFESLYDPAAHVLGRERGSDSDLYMFGFYINNNIGIGFRTFASGIVYGLGSIFFLIYNGLAIGGVAGHLTQVGYTGTFYPFVVGHGAFELTAIVFSGAAGLKLGFALIDPGPYRRLDAIRMAGREAILIVYGAALMLVIAAFIEAFWSSSTDLSPTLKYTVGAALAIFLFVYCCFSGRSMTSQRLGDQHRGS